VGGSAWVNSFLSFSISWVIIAGSTALSALTFAASEILVSKLFSIFSAFSLSFILIFKSPIAALTSIVFNPFFTSLDGVVGFTSLDDAIGFTSLDDAIGFTSLDDAIGFTSLDDAIGFTSLEGVAEILVS